ncbi:MAG: NAD(P)/FAD-dependent oxidoreductase [Alphaproteobacteria bacterium]
MAEKVDCIVIGAGVIGLAIARLLAMAGREVVILEAESAIGTQTSSRNSGVIHAGIMYPIGSLKARVCVEGKKMLYRYCTEHGVGHRRTGKLLVATEPSQIETIHKLKANAAAINMPDLEVLDHDETVAREPAITCTAALWSPTTGIIDVHELMLAYQGDAEDHGAAIAFNSPVEGGNIDGNGITLRTGGPAATDVTCKTLVNSAGLGAQTVAQAIQGIAPETIPGQRLAKGNYFVLAGKSPFNTLIYPVPGQYGLGVHVTLDMGGQTRFGPDVEWVDEIDYRVDESRAASFYEAIRRFWPELPDGALLPGFAGVRPKLSEQRATLVDFIIQGEADHGIPGLVNLYGIESPGLTSSLAIAEHVAALIAKD